MPGRQDGYLYDPEDCDHCDGFHTAYDDEWHDCCDCGLSHRHHGNSLTGEGYTYEIDWDPPLEFKGQGPVYLGFELEVEGPTSGSRLGVSSRHAYNFGAMGPGLDLLADRLGDKVYLHHDGSLRHGVEIVTHPMSYDWAMTNLDWSALPALHDMGWRAASTCGLHVHVSRDGFDGPAHIYRWLKLIYRNAQAMQRLARREDSQWAAFSHQSRLDASKYAKGEHNAHRYQAVNVQNRATFEVRIFASSLRPNHVQSALGLVDATVEYSRGIRSRDVIHGNAWAWPMFAQWVRDQGEKYRPLRNHIWRQARSAMPADTIPRRPISTPDWNRITPICAWCYYMYATEATDHTYWTCALRGSQRMSCSYCGAIGHNRSLCASRYAHSNGNDQSTWPAVVRRVTAARPEPRRPSGNIRIPTALRADRVAANSGDDWEVTLLEDINEAPF